jgi:Ni/Co efflux regulator RcnB
MRLIPLKMQRTVVLAIAAVLAAGPVLADKPAWAGKGGKEERNERRDDRQGERRDDGDSSRRNDRGQADGKRSHFEPRQQVIVRDYYAGQFRDGRRCPPGLAKKHNGCMPPGQAKKWQFGRPLPANVIYYTVPQPLVMQIGAPPSGYRYVRVATDILMIAIGTGMVMDAIADLGR